MSLAMISCRKKPPEEIARAIRLRRKSILVRKDGKAKFLSMEKMVVDPCPSGRAGFGKCVL